MSKEHENQGHHEEIDFLNGLDPDPPAKAKSQAQPPPQPQLRAIPAPAPLPSASTGLHRLLEFTGIALISAALTAGLVVWKLGPRDDRPAPGVDAVALGRAFVPKLANALADGFVAGAEAIQAGKTMGEGNSVLKATFQASRAKAFDDHAGKAIQNLVPDGQEIPDAATREAVVNLFHGFAKGLRGTR